MQNLFERRGFSAPERIAVFHRWLRENGATYPKIDWPHEFSETNGSRGAVALSPIGTGEAIMSIPQKLMISIPTVEASDYDSVFTPVFLNTYSDDLILAVFLMIEMAQGEKSFFHPYLDILPQPDSATQWTPQQIEELDDEDFSASIRKAAASHRHDYDRIFNGRDKNGLFYTHESFFPRDVYSYENYLWCILTVCARCFGRRLPYLALVPLADCLNHANLQTKYDFNIDMNGVFRVYPTGTNRYETGQEVFNSYGRRDNRLLLLEYGFCIPSNEWDVVMLCVRASLAPLKVSATSATSDSLKWKVLMRNGLHPIHNMTLSTRNVAWSLISFFRIENCVEASLPKEYSDKHLLSLENEEGAIRSARSLLSRRLGSSRTTLSDDREFLLLEDISHEQRMALQYRMTRKAILQLHLDLFDYMLALMTLARTGHENPLLELPPAAGLLGPVSRGEFTEWMDAVRRCV